jgi:hypothetical protein
MGRLDKAVSTLRDQALKSNVASCAEKIGTDLALLEGADEDAVRPACQQPFKVNLAHRQGQGGASHRR